MVKEALNAVPIGGKLKPSVTESTHGAHYYVFTKDFGEFGDSSLSIYDEARATVKIPAAINTGIGTQYPRTAYISLGISSAQMDGHAADIGIVSDGDGYWRPVVGDSWTHGNTRFDDCKVLEPHTAKIVAAPVDSTHVRIKVEFYNAAGAKMGKTCDKTVAVTETAWARYHRFASLLNNDNNSSTDGTRMIDGAFTDLVIHHKGTGAYEWLEDWGIPAKVVEYAWIVGPDQCKVTDLKDRSEKFSIDNN